MQSRFSIITLVAAIAVFVASLIAAAYTHTSKSENALVEQVKALIHEIRVTELRFTVCGAACAGDIQFVQHATALNISLTRLMEASALERDLLQHSGTFSMQAMQLYTSRLVASPNINDIAHLQRFRATLDNWHVITATRLQQQHTYNIIQQLLIALVALGCAAGIMVVRAQNSERHAVAYAQQLKRDEDTIDQLHKDLQCTDNAAISDALDITTITPRARAIYSHIKRMGDSIEDSQLHIDLYASLYKVIGFEIRALSNTIKGGLKVLVNDAAEDAVVMGTEINTAADTLESLADNFDQIFAVTNASKKQDTIHLIRMINEIALSISTKCRRNDKPFECLVERSLPITTHGNPVNFYWILLLHLSNAVSAIKYDGVYFHCSTQSSDQVDRMTLKIDIINYDTSQFDFDAINTLEWTGGSSDTQSKNIAKSLIDDTTTFDVARASSEDGPTKFTMSIDIVPDQTETPKKILDTKEFLVCGSSSVQVAVITSILKDYYGSASVISKPSELFRNLGELEKYNAVILTDTVEGIELSSFCKTLRTRMKKTESKCKLILSVSSPDIAAGVYEHVDHTFYRPNDNRQFVTKIAELIEQDSDEAQNEATRALVVDDDPVQQFILSDMLSAQGLSVETVASGEDAVEYFATNRSPLIFMDCIMPGMGGIAATGKIRQMQGDDTPTIIGATALTSAKEHKDCIDGGMDYVIPKPYKDEEIVKILKKFMAISKVS